MKSALKDRKNLTKSLLIVSAIGFFLCAYTITSPQPVVAQTNPQINYQGKLTDDTGATVADGTYNMRFWLLQSEAQATTSAVFTEELTGTNQVQVTNGLFSVMIGSTTSLTGVDFNQTLYLGVEIGGTGGSPSWDGEMSPRKIIGTVPAAFEARQLGGVASTSFLRSDQADTAAGLLSFTGGFVSSASSTIFNLTTNTATTTNFVINSENFTDLTGIGLVNTNGILSVASSSLNLELAGLVDVDTTAAASGTILMFDGSSWYDRATSSLGFAAAGTESLFSDGGTFSFLTDTTDDLFIGTSTQAIGDAKLIIQSEGTNDILNLFETSGTEVLTVLESGNVGIGTSTPTYGLDVYTSSRFNEVAIDGNATSSANHYIDTLNTGSINGALVVDGVKYATLQAAVDACPSSGCKIYYPNNDIAIATTTIDKGIHLIFGQGSFSVTGGITFENTFGVTIEGSGMTTSVSNGGTILAWGGGTSTPMFTLDDVRDSTFRDFAINANASTPLSAGFYLINGAGGTVAPTNRTFERIRINGGTDGLTNGIQWALGAGGDSNNSDDTIRSVHVANYSNAAFRIEHAQSKGHKFYSSTMSGGSSGQYGIESLLGSFDWYGGNGGSNQVADFYLGTANDAISITGGNFEDSGRLLETGASSNHHAITITGVRWSDTGLNADNIAVRYRQRGTLTMIGNLIGALNAEPIEIQVTSSAPTAGVAIGNQVKGTLANPFTGTNAEWTLFGNTRGNNIAHFPTSIEATLGLGTTSTSSQLTVEGDTFLSGNLTATGSITFRSLTAGLARVNSGGVLSGIATSSLNIALSDTTGNLDVSRLNSLTENNLLIGGPGDTVVEVATSSLGLGDGTFLGLSDTPSSYTANRILFTTTSAVASSSEFTFSEASGLGLNNIFQITDTATGTTPLSIRTDSGNSGEFFVDFTSLNAPNATLRQENGGSVSSYFRIQDGSGTNLLRLGQTFSNGLSLQSNNDFQIVVDSDNNASGDFEIAGGSTSGRTGVDGTSFMFINNSGQIGISDRSPDFRFEIATTTGSGYFAVSSDTDTDGDVFVINDSGNIGVGTTSPASMLDVWGDMRVGTSGTATLLVDVSIDQVFLGDNGFRFVGDTDTGIALSYDGAFGFVTGGGTALTLDGASLYSPTTGGMAITHGGGAAGQPTYGFAGDDDTGMYRTGIDELGFATAGIERLTIDAAGNIGIGTTTDSGARLSIRATTTNDILNLFETDGAEVFTVLESGNVGIGDSSPVSLFTVGAGDLFQVNSSGDIITQSVGVDALESEDFGSFTCNGVTCTLDTSAVASSTLAANNWTNGYVLQASTTAAGGFDWVATSSLNINASAAGVAGAVQFSDGSSLTADASNLFWNNTSKRLGIGTSSPTSTLDVWGDLTVNNNTSSGITIGAFGTDVDPYLNFQLTAGTNAYRMFVDDSAAGDPFKIDTQTVPDAFVLTSDGNIGFGTAIPTAELDIERTNINTAMIELNQQGTGDPAIRYTDSVTSWMAGMDNSDGNFKFGTSSDVGVSNVLTLTTSGNVGIGTSTVSTSRLAIQTTGTTDILNLFETGGIEVFTVLESGYVGIGTTSPNNLLTLEQQADNNGFRLYGFDDQDDEYFDFSLNGSGQASLVSTNSFDIESGTSFGGSISSSGETGMTWDAFSQFTITGAASRRPLEIQSGGSADMLNVTSNGGSDGDVLTIDQNGNIGIGTTSPNSLFEIHSSGHTGAGTFGIDQYLTTENVTNAAVQFGNRYYLNASNTATTTIVANIIRVEDDTEFGNTVRALEVQADRGVNTLGENTAISGFGRTFGVRGTTRGDAGGDFEPAGGFFQTEGTSQGNAIRGYSNDITSSELLSLFQDTSTFTGTGMVMNFGNSGGSFNASTSKFVDFQNAGTSKFTVMAHGTTTIGDGTTNYVAGLQIGYGGICVDNDGSCSASTTGKITAVSYGTNNSDLAEMYFSDDDLEPGEIVVVDGGLSVTRANGSQGETIIGVVSTKPGITLGADDTSLIPTQAGYPIALTGRVPIKLSTENGPIKAGDEIMLSSLPGIGMKADGRGVVVGIALEDFDGEYAYTEGFVNQFGDDIAEPNFEPLNINDDPRINDGCYFGGGGATGEEVECGNYETVVEEINEENERREAEAVIEAIEDLATAAAEEVSLNNDTTVKVGQALMFVKLSHYEVDAEAEFFAELFATSTNSEGEEETVWDKLKFLANALVDDFLVLTGIRVETVKTDELCVGNTCVDEATLIELLEGANSQQASPTTPPPSSDDQDADPEPESEPSPDQEENTENDESDSESAVEIATSSDEVNDIDASTGTSTEVEVEETANATSTTEENEDAESSDESQSVTDETEATEESDESVNEEGGSEEAVEPEEGEAIEEVEEVAVEPESEVVETEETIEPEEVAEPVE